MIQSLQQIVRLSVVEGARRRSLAHNIEAARSLRAEAVSGGTTARMCEHLREVSSYLADVVREQLGLAAGVIMTNEFDTLVDWVGGGPDSIPFPYLEAMLILGGHPSALARN